MITINVIEGRISGSYGDTPFSVNYDEVTYNKMVTLQSKAEEVTTMDEYNALMEEFAKLTVQDYKTTIETDCPWIHVNEATGQFFLTYGGVVSSIPMPQALVDRILASMDKEAEYLPLIKMWIRFLRNPILRKKMDNGNGENFANRFFNFVNLEYVHPKLKKELMEDHGLSEEVAERRATMYQMKITKEGLLNGYKVSEEVLTKYDTETGEEVDRYKRMFDPDTGEISGDGLPEHVEDRLFQPAIMGTSGDAFYCEGPNGYAKPGHFIKVGCTHRLPDWSYVNTNDNQFCVKGLHFGGLKYIACYRGEIHNIFVDPMHVGAVPDDHDGAIRCLQYFVHSSLAGVNGSIYHSSTYAAKTDEEWEEMRKEAVEAYAESKVDADKSIAELNALG
tara:strand:+ start:1719 stop:2891 length:1173 start_codon:yes stop_codon:yes gene_type:complete